MNLPALADNLPLVIGAAAAALVIFGGWLDMAYLGLAVRTWGFGSPRVLPARGTKTLLRRRFGKTGPLVGWLFSPYEVIVTESRLIVNFRNAFNRLDIPIESIRALTIRKRPWPMLDDMLIGYSASGTPKQFLLSDNAKPVIRALREAGASFELL